MCFIIISKIGPLKKVLLLGQILSSQFLLFFVDLDPLLPDISVQDVVVFLLHMLYVVLQQLATSATDHGSSAVLDAKILGATGFATVFRSFFRVESVDY